jgi:DNA-binding transcriptional LysR family regulator
VSVTPWIEDELLLVASPKHPIFQEFRHTLIPLNRLASTNWLLRERGSGTREALEHTLLPHLAQIKSCLEFNDHEAIQQSTAQGLGIAYLSKLVVSDMLISGHLVELNTVFGRLNRRFSLLTHHQKQITSGMQRFIDYSINTMPINVEI